MEVPVIFKSQQGSLVGILHRTVDEETSLGVLIIVGGPQTRVGSHRQFVLLARYLASKGIPAFRFDYTGMGDSEGEKSDFLKANADIKSAIEQFLVACPQVKRVVIWGLCDAASMSLLYMDASQQDERIAGLVLLNPWVRQQKSESATYIKHYYLKRMLSKELWVKLLNPNKALLLSAKEFFLLLLNTVKNRLYRSAKGSVFSDQDMVDNWPIYTDDNYVNYMYLGLKNFRGSIQLILSENDMTADEFVDLIRKDLKWRLTLESDAITMTTVKGANHTFSSRKWRKEVELQTSTFIKSLKRY